MDNDSSTVTLSGEPFDPTKVDTSLPNIHLIFGPAVSMPSIDGVDQPPKAALVVQWAGNYRVGADDPSNVEPEWAKLPAYERIYLELGYSLVDDITKSRLFAHKAGTYPLSIDLPCPPYTYENEGTNLRISKGPFSKTGDKEDWEHVIAEMQEAVDNMPQGIDLNKASTLTVKIDLRVTVTKEVELLDLLSYHENLNEDGVWIGDISDLEFALESAIEEYEDYDETSLEDDTYTVEEIDSIRALDLGYVLNSVE